MKPELLSPPPWLTPAAQSLALCLLSNYQRAFGTPLIAGLAADASPLLVAQELFAAELVLLAHDGADPGSDPGPRLIYANRAALRLWQRPWPELVGMPSRLTAEPAERGPTSTVSERTISKAPVPRRAASRTDAAAARMPAATLPLSVSKPTMS